MGKVGGGGHILKSLWFYVSPTAKVIWRHRNDITTLASNGQ